VTKSKCTQCGEELTRANLRERAWTVLSRAPEGLRVNYFCAEECRDGWVMGQLLLDPPTDLRDPA